MGWISVKKSLPKESGNYLVNVHQEDEYRAGDIVLEAWYHAYESPFVPDNIGWSLLNEFYPFSDKMREYITHWQPWPEPPNMDGEEDEE